MAIFQKLVRFCISRYNWNEWFSSLLGANNSDWFDIIVCNDFDPSINPLAPEIMGNGVDDNCDGLIDVIL